MFPPGYSSETASSYFSLLVPMAGSPNGPQEANAQKQLNFIDNFSVTARAHQLKFGADFRHLNPASNIENYDFLIGANSYASLQAGIVDSVYTTGGAKSPLRLTTIPSSPRTFGRPPPPYADLWPALGDQYSDTLRHSREATLCGDRSL